MQKLQEIVDYLKNSNLSLSNTQKDGRINSILNEDEVLKIIEKKFKIEIPTAREWADFYIDETPVNIKITTTTTADNASSKKGLFYALTGKIYKGNSWKHYLKELKENIKETNKDYYFLIINKNHNQDIFYNSLKSLNKVVPNGNNLPFQIKWDENRIPSKKSFKEAKKMLLEGLGKSIKLRADVYFIFKNYFSEYLSEC
jgi:hypothetical protein